MNRPSESYLLEQLSRNFRFDRQLGRIYDQSPTSADDLTHIRGIDTREAVTLNRLGVYHLAQIALWKHRELASFAGELGMKVSTLVEEQWVAQAQALCRPTTVQSANASRSLPASFFRTLSLLICAMLISCMVVYWMNARANQTMHGILSADITSLRVPADSRLISSNVKAGDEVFTGDKLLTLEKTEHLTMISLQRNRVQELQRELQRAEAQASLDLEWRLREVDRDLSEVRTRAHLIQEVKRNPVEPFRSAATNLKSTNLIPISTVSATRSSANSPFYERSQAPRRPNGLMFIGASGESTVGSPTIKIPATASLPMLPKPVETPAVTVSEGKTEGMLSVEASSVEMRLSRLEELRQILPQQVNRAAGVESIRAQFAAADRRLGEMETLSRDIAVLSPGYGKVGQVRYRCGDKMTPGEIMIKILHTERRYVMLNVPTNRVNEIEAGDPVELLFPGRRRYRGKIADLPLLADARADGKSLAMVRVEPSGRLWPETPIGSQIDVVLK